MYQEMQHFKTEFFKALAHPLRIKILEALAEGDKNVNEMQILLGIESSTVSQQLTVLRNKNLVRGIKEGTSVKYSLTDPLINDLLIVTKRIFDNHLVNTISMLKNIKNQ